MIESIILRASIIKSAKIGLEIVQQRERQANEIIEIEGVGRRRDEYNQKI